MLAIVTEVSGGGGTYSGKALVKLPMLNDLMMGVEFSNVEVKKPTDGIKGGCVTLVPASGYFRARVGLSQEDLKAEEVALIDRIRKAQDPGSTYTTMGQQIDQYDQISQQIADAVAAGETPTAEQKAALLAQTTALGSQMATWLENATELIGGTTAGDDILAQIQALIDQLIANQAAIEAGTSFPSVSNIGSTITGITDQIKALLNAPPTDTPRIQNLQATKITDRSATLTWQSDKRFTKYIVTIQKPWEGERIFDVANTKMEVDNLTNASEYIYSVVGYVGKEKTEETPQQFFSTLDNIFPKPKNIVSSKLSETSVKLTWDKDSKHLKYKLKYTDKEGNERFAYPTSNEVTLADLNPDMDYPFELFAIGAANQTAVELGQFSTEIKCNLSLTLTTKYNESRITDGINVLSLAGCLNLLGEMGTIKWANTSGFAEENTDNAKMVFPDGQEAEKTLGFGLALYPQKDDYYTANCTLKENGKNKTCTATIKAAQISNNGDHCSGFKITASNSNPNIGEHITLQAQGCDNGEVFWPEFNKSSKALNIKFKSNITLNAQCSKNELPACEIQITLNEKPNCDFLIRSSDWEYSGYPYTNKRAEKKYEILKMPLLTEPIKIETAGRESFVYTKFDNTNNPYFLVQNYASKMSKTLTIRIRQGNCTKEIIEYGTANKCFHKKITVEPYSDHVKYKVNNCEGTLVWQDGSTDNSYKLFQTDMPTKPYEISATCTEKNRTCMYSDVFSLYNKNLKPEFTVCINQYKGKDQLVEIPKIYLNHSFFGACHPPKVCDITGFDETPTILSTSGCSGQTIWLNGINQKVEQVAADQKVIIDGYYNKPGLYKANCIEGSTITQKEIYLLKNSTGCLEVNASAKKIAQGQEVNIEALGCSSTLSWYNGINEKIQDGPLMVFSPQETDTYTAKCISPACEQQITIEVEPCKLQITSSKGQSLKVLQPSTLELTGCLGEVIWRQDSEILNSETNSIVVRPTQTATYTANCLAGKCETQIELKVESTPPPPIICEELKLLPAANPAPECEKLSITAEGCTNGLVTWTSNGQNYSTTQNHKIDFDVVGSQTNISATCKKSGFPETTANITVPTQLCIKANANPSSIEANRNTLVRITASGCSGTVSIKDMATGISEAMTAATKEVRLNGPRTYELTCKKEGYLPKTTTLRIDISVPLVPKGGESAYQEGTDCGSMGFINQKVCISGNCVENKDLNPLVYSNAGFSPGKYSFKTEASGCTTAIQWEWSDGTITKTSTQKAFEVFPNATGWLRLSCNGCTKSMAIYVNDPWECETFKLTTGIRDDVDRVANVIVFQNTNYCPSYKGVEWFSKSGSNLIDYLGSGPVIESKITKVYAVCEVNGTKCETMLNSTFGASPPVTDLSSARVSSTEQLNTAAATTSNCPADAAVSLQNAMAGYLSHLVCENIYLMGNEDGSFSEEKAALFYKSLKSSLTEAYPTEAENFVFDVSETEAVALFQSQYTAKIADPSTRCTTGDALAAGFTGETTMGNFENMREGYEDVENEIKNRILTLTNLNEIKKTFAKNAIVKFTCQDEGVFGGEGTTIKIKTKEYTYQAEVIGCYDNAGSVFTFDSTNISFNGSVVEITSKENKEVKLRYTFADTTSEATMKYIVKWIKSKEFEVTGKQLKLIFPGTSQARCDEVAKLINKYAEEYGLTSNERLAHFIGQIGAETQLKFLDEGSYSAARILTAEKTRTTYSSGGKRYLKYCSLFNGHTAGQGCPYPACDPKIEVPKGSFSGEYNYATTEFMNKLPSVKPEMVDELPRDPDFFSTVYACQLNNGGIESGDGYRFRGRGFIQITGQTNYQTMVQNKWDAVNGKGSKDFMCRSTECDNNLDDIADDLDFSMLISLTFWKSGNTNNIANEISKKSIEDVTEAVNGRQIGIEHRTKYTNKAYEILKK
jgi:predicted chitinase